MLNASPHAPVNGRLSCLGGLNGGADVGRGEVLAPAEAVFHLLLRLGDVLILLLDAQELAVAVQLPAATTSHCQLHSTQIAARRTCILFSITTLCHCTPFTPLRPASVRDTHQHHTHTPIRNTLDDAVMRQV